MSTGANCASRKEGQDPVRHSQSLPLPDAAGVQLLELFDLGIGDVHNVAVGAVPYREILVIALGRVELVEGDDLGHDRIAKDVSIVELPDVGLGDTLLFLIHVEDGAAILGADVWALAVEGGGVVGDAEEDLE